MTSSYSEVIKTSEVRRVHVDVSFFLNLVGFRYYIFNKNLEKVIDIDHVILW